MAVDGAALVDVFLSIIKQMIADAQQPAYALATVDPAYASGRPSLLFDGETAVTTRTWPYLAAYTPVANDRVLVAKTADSNGVVLGKIV